MRRTIPICLALVLVLSVGVSADEDADVLIPKIEALTLEDDFSVWAERMGSIFVDHTHISSHSEFQYTDDEDLSAMVYFGWDEDNFYIAADVTDDVVIMEQFGGDIWQNDCMEFWINDAQFGATLEFDEPYLHSWHGVGMRDVDVDVVIVDHGYQVRVILPWQNVIDSGHFFEAVPDEFFWFSVGFDDADEPGMRKGQLYYPKTWDWGNVGTYAIAILAE